MKITNDRPATGPIATHRKSETSPSAAPTIAGSTSVGDVTAVLGIPESEFTPRVRDAIMRLMAEVDRLRQELHQTRHRLEESETLADRDPLLPILNRRAFVREMSRIMSFAERYDLPASLLYFDLDGFKAINDTYGHATGDAALAHVSSILIESTRESDVVGRLGGDEFGVILAKAGVEDAVAKADALAEIIRSRPLAVEGATITISCAHGATTFQAGENATEAIAKADRAMYAQKHKTRKRDGGGGA